MFEPSFSPNVYEYTAKYDAFFDDDFLDAGEKFTVNVTPASGMSAIIILLKADGTGIEIPNGSSFDPTKYKALLVRCTDGEKVGLYTVNIVGIMPEGNPKG